MKELLLGFFSFAGPHVIMEFASYLNYRGVPVEGPLGASGERDGVLLATPALASGSNLTFGTLGLQQQ